MRDPTLRQLEALMAVVETGTVSQAADLLRISQPAASKLLQDLEANTALELFERESGRLIPTGRGMRLYEEVERIFGGVRQLARAVEAIRREERGHIFVGVMPALSGAFVTRALAAFQKNHPDVFITIESRSSQFLTDAVLLRRLDIALVISSIEHPSISVDTLKSPPAVAVLPEGHPLMAKSVLRPADFEDTPFVAFSPTSMMRRKVDAAFEEAGLNCNIVMEANTAPNVAELVAGGMGVTVADPLAMEIVAGRVVVRPFLPEVSFEYSLMRPVRARNSVLVEDFVRHVQAAAADTKVLA
ncbi:LysR family transcriptional regulator [Notoacmeibacter ruber]|uniref:LysR family transcriptional regulator n=1 Tax=Notoacmeibacter ruber TaxID=2670375 RepID=A0A3L7J3Z4_9HYPH|nr:LysR family transcriptional regulator [Notoacmeibacter ruber]